MIQVRDEVVQPLRAYGAYPQVLHTAKSDAPLLIAMLETHFRLADPKDAQASEAFGRYLADIVALQLGAQSRRRRRDSQAAGTDGGPPSIGS